MIPIQKIKNKIIIEKNNMKNTIKFIILYEIFAIILSFFSGLKSEYILYIFAFYTGIIILGILSPCFHIMQMKN